MLARWRIVLDDPGVIVLLDEHDGEPVGYAAVADGWLRHFGLLPALVGDRPRADSCTQQRWTACPRPGRTRRTSGCWRRTTARAAFYERLGWRDTGVREPEVFEPYPVKMQMTPAG